ncbi:MAG TPA: ABATE domain-containing protein [Bryobacteraceae bacterium]|jgi:predicted RNA-binding Zn ribbon-like protein|nr:ABATE domain-containing protein [Bryobacteraceae bacterium]
MSPSLSLCLDFANTLSWRTSEKPEEKLLSYTALVQWGRRAGIVSVGEARAMIKAGEPSKGMLLRAILLRESIYRIFAARAAERRARPSDLAILNETVREALGHLRLVAESKGFAWRWLADIHAASRILWAVARSAAELLTSTHLGTVRVCAGAGCGWLFLDLSRNRSRRWCAMSDCGNREKARRHYQRVRQTRPVRND